MLISLLIQQDLADPEPDRHAGLAARHLGLPVARVARSPARASSLRAGGIRLNSRVHASGAATGCGPPGARVIASIRPSIRADAPIALPPEPPFAVFGTRRELMTHCGTPGIAEDGTPARRAVLNSWEPACEATATHAGHARTTRFPSLTVSGNGDGNGEAANAAGLECPMLTLPGARRKRSTFNVQRATLRRAAIIMPVPRIRVLPDSARQPHRRRRGGRAAVVGGQGAGREQPRRRGARIEVELVQGGRSLVRVEDDGCGMDAGRRAARPRAPRDLEDRHGRRPRPHRVARLPRARRCRRWPRSRASPC